MTNKVELTQIREWVIIDRETGMASYFETFDEAIHSPIKGHVMSEYYYEYNYKNILCLKQEL